MPHSAPEIDSREANLSKKSVIDRRARRRTSKAEEIKKERKSGEQKGSKKETRVKLRSDRPLRACLMKKLKRRKRINFWIMQKFSKRRRSPSRRRHIFSFDFY